MSPPGATSQVFSIWYEVDVWEAYTYGIPYMASGSVSDNARTKARLSMGEIEGRLVFTPREPRFIDMNLIFIGTKAG